MSEILDLSDSEDLCQACETPRAAGAGSAARPARPAPAVVPPKGPKAKASKRNEAWPGNPTVFFGVPFWPFGSPVDHLEPLQLSSFLLKLKAGKKPMLCDLDFSLSSPHFFGQNYPGHG